MAENINITGKDYRTVAMENAYQLAEGFFSYRTGDNVDKLVAIARLTDALYRQMIGYTDISIEKVQAILENKS